MIGDNDDGNKTNNHGDKDEEDRGADNRSEGEEARLQNAAHIASTAALALAVELNVQTEYILTAVLGRTKVGAGTIRRPATFKYNVTFKSKRGAPATHIYFRSMLEGWHMTPMLDKFDEVYDSELAPLHVT